MDFRELLSRHAAVAIEKQLLLARSVAGRSWSWDLQASSFRFDDRTYAFQLLGTEDEETGRWRWAWGDVEQGLPAHLLGAAFALRNYGLRKGVPQLAQVEVEAHDACGQEIAAVSCGLLDVAGWWRAPLEGGTAWMLLTDLELPKGLAPVPVEMARVLTRALAIFPVDHALALDAYVLHHGGSVERAGATATARMQGGGHMVARFDESQRIARLEAKVA